MADDHHHPDAVKLQSYQSLVEDRLRPLLERKRQHAERTRQLAAEFTSLAVQLSDILQNTSSSSSSSSSAATSSSTTLLHQQPARVLTDIGAGYKMQARIPNPSTATVCINVGCDVYVDMPIADALSFATQRAHALQREAYLADDEAIRVSTDLQVAAAGLQELQLQFGRNDNNKSSRK